MTARINEALRKQAWLDGEQAGRSGYSAQSCTYQSGTIYADDWHDGFDHGQRFRQAKEAGMGAR